MKPDIVTHIHNKPIYRQSIGALPYNKALSIRAKTLRKAGNFAEVIFWKQVRNGTFWNLDFDRQRIIGSFIVDFYVKSLGLIIEIDGSSHNEKEEYDAMRETFLVNHSLTVYRISDIRVKHDLGNVMRGLEDFIIQEFGTSPML
jgi:very-short-patch-repair endonuclease